MVRTRKRRWFTVLATVMPAAAFVIVVLFLIGAGYLEWHALQDDESNRALSESYSTLNPGEVAANARHLGV